MESIETSEADARPYVAPEKPPCLACGGSGWLGGPSYYNPGEGGEPCPDCAQAVAATASVQVPPAKTEGSGEPIPQEEWNTAFSHVSAYLRARKMGADLGQVAAMCDVVAFALKAASAAQASPEKMTLAEAKMLLGLPVLVHRLRLDDEHTVVGSAESIKAIEMLSGGQAAPGAQQSGNSGEVVAASELKRQSRLLETFGKIIHNTTVAQQAAWIEWKHGKGAEAAMGWIQNGLLGPGHIPDEDEPYGKEPQAYYDANCADPLPQCACGRPSNIAWMGQGFCSQEHYGTLRNTTAAKGKGVGDADS